MAARKGRRQITESEEETPSWLVPGSPDYLAVRVLVVDARSAQRIDKKGKVIGNPDLFVRVSYYGNSWETQLMRNTTAPKWGETFEVPIPPERRNALGELEIKLWDANSEKKNRESPMGEVRLPLGDYGGVNYDFVEPRRYKLKNAVVSTNSRGDPVQTRVTLRVGMVLPGAKRKFEAWDASKGERTTESYVEESEVLVDESHASVMRSLRLIENTVSTATSTLENLEKQGDQLRRVQEDVDEIGEKLDRGDRHMRSIKSWTGAIANKFSRTKQHDTAVKAELMTEEQRLKREEDEFKASKREKSKAARPMARSSPSTGRKTEDEYAHLSQDSRTKIDQTDKALDRIDECLDHLKLMAFDMGEELDDHNRRLGLLNRDINTQTSHTTRLVGDIKRRL